jgi:hypothetical protein
MAKVDLSYDWELLCSAVRSPFDVRPTKKCGEFHLYSALVQSVAKCCYRWQGMFNNTKFSSPAAVKGLVDFCT